MMVMLSYVLSVVVAAGGGPRAAGLGPAPAAVCPHSPVSGGPGHILQVVTLHWSLLPTLRSQYSDSDR